MPTICCIKEIYERCKDDKLIGTKIQAFNSTTISKLVAHYSGNTVSITCSGTTIQVADVYASLASCQCATSSTGSNIKKLLRIVAKD